MCRDYLKKQMEPGHDAGWCLVLSAKKNGAHKTKDRILYWTPYKTCHSVHPSPSLKWGFDPFLTGFAWVGIKVCLIISRELGQMVGGTFS